MAVMFEKIRRMLWNFLSLFTLTDTTLVEFESSTTLILLGVMLLLPGQSLLQTTPFHAILLALLPEPWWGVIALAFGLGQSLANMLRLSWGRKASAFGCACLYGFLAICALKVKSIFLPFLFTLSLVQAFVYLRITIAREQLKNAGA